MMARWSLGGAAMDARRTTLAIGLAIGGVSGCAASTPWNPHPHDFVLTEGSRYEKNPDVALTREYWIIIEQEDGTRAMLPRPDGDPRIVEECKTGSALAKVFEEAQLCSSAPQATLARVNALTDSEARQTSTFLHQKLRFTANVTDATPGAAGPSFVEPYALTSDVLDVCKTYESDRNGRLRAVCDRELQAAQSGSRSEVAVAYALEEARALAERLNELYGIPR